MVWHQQPEDVSSPNYPSDYPDDFYQEYSLKFPGAARVRLHFDDFYTEYGYDRVYIYEATVDNFVDENGDNFVDVNNNNFSDDGPLSLVQTLQGYLGPTTSITITGDTVYWIFDTDGSVNYRGWHIDYIEGEYELEATSIDLEIKFDKPLPNDWPPDVYPQNFGIELSTPVLESHPIPNSPALELSLTFSIPTAESYPIPVLPPINIGDFSFPSPILTRRIPEYLPPIYREIYLLEFKEPVSFSAGPPTYETIFNNVIPIYVSMASCQIQISIDAQNYVSAVIPNAIKYIDIFATKTILTVYYAIKEINTGQLQKDVLAIVKLDDINITQSPSDYSASIKGHLLSGPSYRATFRETFNQVMGLGEYDFVPTPIRISLKKVRNISLSNGKLSVECNVDPFLRPKFYAILPDGTEFIIGRVSTRLAPNSAVMTIEER